MLAAAAVVVVASARPVLAVEPYVGAQYMQSKSSCQGFRDGVAPLGLTATCDETDGGYRVLGGLNLGSTFGLEVGYQDAGEGHADAFNHDVYALTLTSPLTAWDAVVTVRKELEATRVSSGAPASRAGITKSRPARAASGPRTTGPRRPSGRGSNTGGSPWATTRS